jgi:hypothetical protein
MKSIDLVAVVTAATRLFTAVPEHVRVGSFGCAVVATRDADAEARPRGFAGQSWLRNDSSSLWRLAVVLG